jgi:molybdate transport system substrate-binding protein
MLNFIKRSAVVLAVMLFARGAPLMAADAQPEVTVYAAASLTNALEDLAKAYDAAKGGKTKFSFASSSTLIKQIQAGAPAQIFVSADEKWMDYASAKDLIEKASVKKPIGNKLVLIAPASSKLDKVDIKGSDLAKLLGDGRLATGDPDHVPVGLYAKEALQKLGQWTAIEPRLARADSVRGALAFVETGEVPLGIVYETDAKVSAKVKIVGELPADTYKPVVYPFAIVKGQDNTAVRGFYDYITGDAGLAVFTKYGFSKK